MNKWRIGGLIAVVLLATWLGLRSCAPEEPAVEVLAPPAREAFHASKPLRIEVLAQPDAAGKTPDVAWLDHELRYLLGRGQMRVAPVVASPSANEAFTLRVDISGTQQQAWIRLIAPDKVVERELPLQLEHDSRLALLRSLVAPLPKFLGAVNASADWTKLIGSDDARSYESFVSSAMEVLGPTARGFTRPPAPTQRSRVIERLEAFAKAQPRHARAWGVLAASYLSVGGEDETSLAQLAESTAERALELDDELAIAHSAMGLVHLRRNEWIAAREQFDRALSLDANNPAALEGLACLLVDAGRYMAARPIAERAVLIQPLNIGARECLAYARVSEPSEQASINDAKAPEATSDSPAAARVNALVAILDGDTGAARQTLRSSLSSADFNRWADPMLRAATDRRRIPDALQAVTAAASELDIDASTEILCGVALRQSEFVFNRMSRLGRQREHVPLRILWLPQTAFLRQRRRMEEIVGAAGLPAFWQEHGLPDVCSSEPHVYGCKLRTDVAKKE